MNNNKIFNLVSLFVLSYSKVALLINDSDLNPNLRKLMNKAFIKNSLPEVIQYQEIISKYRFSEDGIDALLDENNLDEFCKSFYGICEFLSDFSNTIVFRQYTIKSGRTIDTINTQLSKEFVHNIESSFRIIKTLFDYINSFNDDDFEMTSSRGKVSKYESVGFKPGVTISNVVSGHINDLYLCCDIGKFFNNVKWNRFIEQSLFYEFYKDQPAEYQFMPGLLDALMGPIMHNSVLPTGAPYSPAISNFFLIDFTNNMKSNFIKDMEDINPNYADNEYKITRYADDITISCKEHPDGDDGLLNIDAAKVIEKYLNEKHLHLKYSKTKVFDRRKTNVPILGYSIPKKINDNEIVQINTTSAFRRNFINIVRNNWTLAHLNEKEMGILSYYLKNTHFYNVFDVCANLGSYINEFDRKRKNDVYSLKIETSYSIFAHFERNREINDKVLKETVYNFLYEIYNTDPLFNIMDCIETTYFTDFNDSYVIYFKVKPHSCVAPWSIMVNVLKENGEFGISIPKNLISTTN